MMRNYVPEEIEILSSPDAPPRPSTREPGQPIQEVCASQKLEEVLHDPNVELKVSYKVPESEAAKYVSEKTTGMEMPPEAQFVGKTAGLGLKRKNAEIAKEMKAKKAKTLAEKRDQLEDDIMKYGLAAIEKLYPRQPLNEVQPSVSPNKKQPRAKGTPIKMKPKPLHLDFEEVDARKILKPFSHGKYIKEPEYDHMVYINRREGLVPLSSLCKEDAKSVMSSNVKLLKGRNVRLGKPRVFVKENGRLVAIGGSRDPAGKGIKVLRAPKLVKILPMERMLPFEIDPEYASFAVSAIPDIPKSKRVDIRVLKRLERQKRLENKPLTEVLSEDNSSIVKHLWDKLGNNPDAEELEIAVEKATKPIEQKNDEKMEEVEEKEDENIVQTDDDISTDATKDFELGAHDKVHNEWSNPKTRGKMPIDMTDDKPIVSEEFKKAMEAKKGSNALSGVDVCDVPDCYVCLVMEETAAPSKCDTPSASQSGSATPKDGGKVAKTKTAKNLKKVQRALKTLGVNFLHFDDEHQASDHEKSGQVCDKDHCKLGCICDSITGKNSLPPSHCGKVECMFHCVCSKDALKLTNNDSNKIGISAEGLRSSAYRRLAQEELKFSNTVVASGVDLLMIGGSSGRQKRERKVPSRYQDTDAFFDSATGMPATSSQKAAAVLMLEDTTQILPASGIPANSSTRRLTQDSLKHEKIKKCAVIMPRLDLDPNIKLWCLYHNQHDCPCFKLKNPLDHGPDLNISRNVAKRTLGSNFKTKKRLSSGSKPREYFGTLDLTEPPSIEDLRSTETLEDPEVIEEDPVLPAMDPKFWHDPNVHSSRTFGHAGKNLAKPTKYPHQIIVLKKDKSKKPLPPLKNIENIQEQNQEMPKITSVTSLKQPMTQFRTIAPKPIAPKPPKPNTQTVLPPVTNSSGVRKQTVIINPKPTTEQVDDWRELRLGVKAKGSFIFVYWRVLRGLIESGRVKILAYTKTKQLALLVMWTENATVTQDMIDIHKNESFNDNTHPMFQKMKKLPELMDQDNTHVALIFNGLYWEVAGMAMQQLKEGAINADVQVIPKPNTKRNRHDINDQNAPPKVVYPSDSSMVKEAAPMNRLNPTSEIQVDPSTRVQKLPQGINLVNMNRPGMPTPIQVKLPLTEFNQFWCTINVDGPELSVQVDLALTLKVAILKQAASLAAREKTTVRIPIKVPGEVDSFGVYAVPGLESHVFVGPFTAKEPIVSSTTADDDDDIVCLDEPQETKPDPLALQVPSPKQPAKQPVVIDNAKIRQEAILGQVPQKVIKEEGDADIISHDDDYQMVADRDLHPEPIDPLYLNPSKNPYGRVVINSDKNRKDFYEEENTNIIKLKIKDTETKVFMGKGNVTFMHPTLDDHEVFCENLNKAKLWLECHIGTSDKSAELQQLIEDNAAKKSGLSIKPMCDLIEPEHEVTKSPPPPLPDNTPIARIVNGRRFVCHQVQHNGRQGVAIVFDRRQHSDMRKLYHKLNQVLSSNGLKKITSSLQILNRARDEILRLEKLDEDYNMKRKALSSKRQDLFKEFTGKLGHLESKEEKKAAVIKLKEGLKKKENKIIGNPQRAGHHDEAVTIKIDTDSKLNPTENEIKNTRDELLKLMPPKPIGQMRISNSAMHMSNSMASSSSSGITPYSDITGLQTVKKDGKVLRPMNAFMLWAKQKRKDLIAQGIDGAMVSKMLAGQWKQLDSAEQQKYFNEAERLKNLHQLQHPNYKFNPKAKRMGMKKSVSRLEPLTRVSQPAAPRVQENYYTVNVPDSASEASEDVVRYNAEDIAIHNLSSDQNIAIQPADSIPSTAPSQPLPQIIPIPGADQTFTTSIVELE